MVTCERELVVLTKDLVRLIVVLSSEISPTETRNLLDISSQQFTGSMTSPSFAPAPLRFKGTHFSVDEDYENLANGVSQVVQPRVELPKDRPFANLASTSSLPQTYATILRAQVDPQEKAKRLRAALRRDNIQLLAYFLMLYSMGSLAFFQVARGG